ncbi:MULTISPECIES: sec-independent translocase [Streptacidiphilus]|uniref:Sec-independent protein translocase protein TatB n=1 Tax=Streptacidiphilus cavernicola TaxID=3342716 RepID=A0ABV6UHK9_9ACTN|nr:sec-independent translocase [Streptacidiphilus jeojiense]
MFDISPFKLVALIVLAVIIFGPDKLPKLVADAMGIIRKIREFSDSAKEDIRKELGPEFKDFEFEDLNPKTFVRKQLATHGEEFGLNDLQELKNGFSKDAAAATAAVKSVRSDPLAKVADDSAPQVDMAKPESTPAAAERPAYDVDAT